MSTSSLLLFTLVVFLLGLLLGLLLLWLWLIRRRRPRFRHPERFNETALARELGRRLAGTPADGSEPATDQAYKQVVWVEAGDEVLVHLDSLRAKLVGRTLLVSLELESDQTGRGAVVVGFGLGDGSDGAGLIVTADGVAHGHPLLASRWGAAVRASVWNSLLGMAEDHAAERGLAPAAISAAAGQLRIGVGAPLRVTPGEGGAA